MENSDIRASEKRSEWKNVVPSHEKLWVWQKANRLHLEICKICMTLPRNELYQLRPQIERASKSVKDNIAEGNESYYFNDKQKGFLIARKEAAETQNHLREMEQKNYLAQQNSQDMIDEYEEIKRGINGLVKRISERKELTKERGSRRL